MDDICKVAEKALSLWGITGQTVVPFDLYEEARGRDADVLCAEAVLLAVSPGFGEPFDTTRTHIKRRIGEENLQKALSLTCTVHRLHPYFYVHL